jgi:hypothetical protein
MFVRRGWKDRERERERERERTERQRETRRQTKPQTDRTILLTWTSLDRDYGDENQNDIFK